MVFLMRKADWGIRTRLIERVGPRTSCGNTFVYFHRNAQGWRAMSVCLLLMGNSGCWRQEMWDTHEEMWDTHEYDATGAGC